MVDRESQIDLHEAAHAEPDTLKVIVNNIVSESVVLTPRNLDTFQE